MFEVVSGSRALLCGAAAMARTKNLRRRTGAKKGEPVASTKAEQTNSSKDNGQQLTNAKTTPVGKKGKKRLPFRKNTFARQKAAVEPVEDLAGIIFMCNTETKKDCFKYHVFGLPEAKKDVVERATKGIKLFLFDIDQKVLYGVYRASSLGGMNLESEAFQGSERKFPAQIRFRIHKDCAPLDESEFKPAIKENYFGRFKFRCELNAEQVGKLVRLFQPLDSRGLPKSKPAKDFKGETFQKGRSGTTASYRSGKFQPPAGRFPLPPVREAVANYSVVQRHPSSYSGHALSLEASYLDNDLYRSRLDEPDRRPYLDPVLDASLRLGSDITRRRLTEDLYPVERSLLPFKGSLLYDDLYRDIPYQREAIYGSRESGRPSLGTLPYKTLSSLPWGYQ